MFLLPVGEVCLRDSAASSLLCEEVWGGGGIDTWVVFGLWELVDSGIVERVVLLGLGGLMPDWGGPCVFRGGPRAVALDIDVVGSSADAEETALTPVVSPRVSHEPVWATALVFTVSYHRHVVNDVHVASVVTEDSTSVSL